MKFTTMEKNVKYPKEKTLYKVNCISQSTSRTIYIVAIDINTAEIKAKIMYPYMAISTATKFLTINE